jgi:hypothetical protein
MDAITDGWRREMPELDLWVPKTLDLWVPKTYATR